MMMMCVFLPEKKISPKGTTDAFLAGTFGIFVSLIQ
jgi:hypothetical protein